MGRIRTSRIKLISEIGEIVGYKSGLAATRDELGRFVPERYEDLWLGPDEAIIVVRAEVVEELVTAMLFGLGNIESSVPTPPGIALFHRYKDDPARLSALYRVMELTPDFLGQALLEAQERGSKTIDPRAFVEEAQRVAGDDGRQIAIELLLDMNRALHRSPWTQVRRVDWRDEAKLRALYQSESLETYYGNFLDQRYIDFLGRNFDDIDHVNWRKFEALTCEFFDRQGFHVEIGPGRNDGGLDARIWPTKDDTSKPPALIVQCKRQKRKVDKMVVKALWADVVEEEADSGLIVTSTAVSPGAKRVCQVRSYPIETADRETLRTWIAEMRTPDAGIFMAE